jgi:phage/plasmid primase-like uncharacterized protein
MLAQAQGAQQILVADQDQTKSGRFGQVQAQEQAHFLQAAISKVLGVIQNDERDDLAQFGQGGLDLT